jgi:hypothetical protein
VRQLPNTGTGPSPNDAGPFGSVLLLLGGLTAAGAAGIRRTKAAR